MITDMVCAVRAVRFNWTTKFLITAILLICCMISYGVLTYSVWHMFIPMLPFKLPLITFKEAVVLNMLLGIARVICVGYSETKQHLMFDDFDESVQNLVSFITNSGVILAISWVVWIVLKI